MTGRDSDWSTTDEASDDEEASREAPGEADPSAGYDSELLATAKSDLESIVEYHEEWHLQSERDFQGIFRFNILVAGGFVSVLAYGDDLLNVTEISNVVNVWTGFAGVFWVLSTLAATASYVGVWHLRSVEKIADVNQAPDDRETPENVEVSEDEVPEEGLFEEAPLADVVTEADDRSEYDRRLLDYYVQAITHNRKEGSEYRYALFHLSLLLLLVAVVVFALGIASVQIEFGVVETTVAVMFVLSGVVLSGLVIYKLWAYRDRLKRKIWNVLRSQ